MHNWKVFYPPVKINGIGTFVDGALVAANPTEAAVVEASEMWPDNPISLVVSVGTGKKRLLPREHNGRTNAEWAITMIELLLESERVSGRLEWLGRELKRVHQSDKVPDFFRINTPAELDLGNIGLDEKSDRVLKEMVMKTRVWLKTDQVVQAKLSLIADLLCRYN
ncbi:Calcium-independent phospholipase A2-gamma [Bonamia ostreae]|uniref:Calcium-independent phospholipase A2-gamma n=1 Tax=Bonamia ostreae TaxID=126728 RepID=A0ABV2ALB7_9EUKA